MTMSCMSFFMIFYPLKPVANRTVYRPGAPRAAFAVPVEVTGNSMSLH
jgi:hypothetical protein